jgi:hypothetical protein
MNELILLQYIVQKHLVCDSATINYAISLINSIANQLDIKDSNKQDSVEKEENKLEETQDEHTDSN